MQEITGLRHFSRAQRMPGQVRLQGKDRRCCLLCRRRLLSIKHQQVPDIGPVGRKIRLIGLFRQKITLQARIGGLQPDGIDFILQRLLVHRKASNDAVQAKLP